MNIFVAKLNSRTTSETLNELFSQFGEVISAKVIIDRETGNSKQFGFVEMSDENAAHAAIEKLDSSELDGSRIVVKKSVPREEGRPNNGNNRFGNRNREFRPRHQGGYEGR